MAGLNPAQDDAVRHERGPLLVSAGAGSGKTRVLTQRIAHLIDERGVSPMAILAITFTNKAADEMRTRVMRLVGPEAKSMWVRTFHSACARILRRDAERLGFPADFSIYDADDSVRLTRYAMVDLGLDVRRQTPRSMHARISAAKNEMIDPEAYAEQVQDEAPYLQHTAEVFAEYQRRLVAAAAMDFDDLLGMTVRLLNEHPSVLERYRHRFEHILVDEYQDTNKAQNELVLMLGAEHTNVFVVGDSDQSIYAFRGARVSNIGDFEAAFDDVTVILLEQNYRSTQTILDAANAVISKNLGRHPKRLWTDAGHGEPIVWYRATTDDNEAIWVVEEIRRLRRHGHDLGDFAVMYRINAQSRAVEAALRAADLPYRLIGGTAFFERREVRDALAYLRAVVNRDDEVSLKRVVNVPRRGVGPRSIQLLNDYAAARGMSFGEALRWARAAGLARAAQKGVGRFTTLLDEAAELAPAGPRDVLEHLLVTSGYLQELQEAGEGDIESRGRLENLSELVNMTEAHDTLEGFLEEAALVSPTDQLDADEQKVVLLTVHSAKGLEFPVVFLVGMEERMFPRDQALDDPEELEEERRLAYVGITRAQRRLYVSDAENRRLWGTTQYCLPSRFVKEIPSEFVEVISGRPNRDGEDDDFDSGIGDDFGDDGDYGSHVYGGSADRHRRRQDRDGNRRASYRAPLRAEQAPTPAPGGEPLPGGPGGLTAAEISVGADVRHPAWGPGVVIDLSGSGADAEATVRFGSVGEKRLLLAWARLERVAP